MSNYFVDTSALSRRYIQEIGSLWVRNWIEPQFGHVIVVSNLTIVELRSMFARRLREGTLLLTAATALRNDFLIHLQKEYLITYVDEPIFQLAAALVEKYPLRTLDALQLASAIDAQQTLGEPLIFISGDVRLLTAATGEGFITDDPYQHP